MIAYIRACCLFVVALITGLAGCDQSEGSWANATQHDRIDVYSAFIAEFPNNAHVAEARHRIENLLWDHARKVDESGAYLDFLKQFPDSSHKSFAAELLTAARWNEAQSTGKREDIVKFIGEYPESKFSSEAKAKLEEIDYQIVLADSAIPAVERFLETYPAGRFTNQAQEELQRRHWGITIVDTRASKFIAGHFLPPELPFLSRSLTGVLVRIERYQTTAKALFDGESVKAVGTANQAGPLLAIGVGTMTDSATATLVGAAFLGLVRFGEVEIKAQLAPGPASQVLTYLISGAVSIGPRHVNLFDLGSKVCIALGPQGKEFEARCTEGNRLWGGLPLAQLSQDSMPAADVPGTTVGVWVHESVVNLPLKPLSNGSHIRYQRAVEMQGPSEVDMIGAHIEFAAGAVVKLLLLFDAPPSDVVSLRLLGSQIFLTGRPKK